MRDEESGWITLHPGELFLIWTEHGLGDLPAVLDLPHAGRTAAARAGLADIASEALAARGLGTVSQPARDLEAMLRGLASPALALDLTIGGDGVYFRAAGATGPHGDVVAGVADGDVRLGPVRAAAQPAAILDAASPLQAGLGSPGNARMADYARACRAGEYEGATGFLEVLRSAGVRPAEANTFLRAVTKAVGGGQFGATARGRDGRPVRTPATVNWVDTEDGRYALRRSGDWVTVTPVAPQRLLSMVEEMVADLA